MTYEETISKVKADNPQIKAICFDYYRSIKNNTVFAGKRHFVMTSEIPNVQFMEDFGLNDDYDSSDMFTGVNNLIVVDPVSDWETLLNEDGIFDRNKALRYFD